MGTVILFAMMFAAPPGETLPAGKVDIVRIQRTPMCMHDDPKSCELCAFLARQPLYEVRIGQNCIGWLEPINSDWYAITEFQLLESLVETKSYTGHAESIRKHLKILAEARKSVARWRSLPVYGYGPNNPNSGAFPGVYTYDKEPQPLIVKLLKENEKQRSH